MRTAAGPRSPGSTTSLPSPPTPTPSSSCSPIPGNSHRIGPHFAHYSDWETISLGTSTRCEVRHVAAGPGGCPHGGFHATRVDEDRVRTSLLGGRQAAPPVAGGPDGPCLFPARRRGK